MSNTGRGKGKKGNALPQDYNTMSHHIGGMATHSQPPHMQYTVTPPVASVEMTTPQNDMNQPNYNTGIIHQQRRLPVQMTLPPTAQLQQDANSNGNTYTVQMPRHGHGHLANHPSHMMSQPPPPQQSYQHQHQPHHYYPAMQYQQPPFPQMQPPHAIPAHYQQQPRPQPAIPSRPKKVLTISDPDTKCVINEKEVATSTSVAAPATSVESAPSQVAITSAATIAPVEQSVVTDNAVKPAVPLAAESVLPRAPSSTTTAIQQRFRAEVTNRALGTNASFPIAELQMKVEETTQEVPKTAEEPQPVVASEPALSEPAPQQVPVAETPAAAETPVEDVVVAEAPKAEDVTPAAAPSVPDVQSSPAPVVTTSVDVPAPAPTTEQIPAIPEVTVAEVAAEGESEKPTEEYAEVPREDEVSAEEKKAALVKKHEQKITSLREDSSVDLVEKIYSRTYMYAIRDCVAELSIWKCKLSEEELKKFGLDRASMPNPPDNKKRHDPNFLPQWIGEGNQAGQRRPKYTGRGSDNTRYPQRNKKNLPTRPSIERTHKTVEPSHKAEKAWKPAAKAKGELDENQKKFKDIRGLLNKITPTSYPELSQEFIKYEAYKEEDVRNTVIDIIFDKAVEEPKFCPLYSDLCKLQTNCEYEQSQSRLFRDGILQKCQKTFEAGKPQEQALREEIEQETDEKKKSQLQDNLQEIIKKEKRRVIGNIGFISQLYRHSLITPSILSWCVVHLLRCDQGQEKENGDEESLECAVKLLTCVGKTWEQTGKSPVFQMESYIAHLTDRSNTCSNRVRFMIIDLVDLKNRNWIPRKSADTGPKTINEIQMEARNEELQNKVARDNYNERRGLGNSRSKDFSQSGRRNYGGRPSDKRLQGSSSNVLPVDRSLKKCEPQTSLSSTKNWSGGAGGGGVQAWSSQRPVKGFSLTAAVRGNDSQNSSREQSESRKNSLASRALNNKTVEPATNGAPPSQPDNELEEKLQEPNKKIVNGVRNDLNEYMEKLVTIDEAFESIQDRCSQHSIPEVFMNFISVGGDETKADKRKHLGQMLARCLSDKDMHEQALVGITAYCNYVVRCEYWDETANVWEFVADVFRHAILCENDIFDGARPSIADFDSAFLAANGDQRKPYRLLISLLLKLINDDDHNIASMAFLELKEDFRNEPGLRAALEQEKTNGSQHTNLYALLNAQ